MALLLQAHSSPHISRRYSSARTLGIAAAAPPAAAPAATVVPSGWRASSRYTVSSKPMASSGRATSTGPTASSGWVASSRYTASSGRRATVCVQAAQVVDVENAKVLLERDGYKVGCMAMRYMSAHVGSWRLCACGRLEAVRMWEVGGCDNTGLSSMRVHIPGAGGRWARTL